jgi:hypothetical protein
MRDYTVEHPASCESCGHKSDCGLHNWPAAADFPELLPTVCTCKPNSIIAIRGRFPEGPLSIIAGAPYTDVGPDTYYPMTLEQINASEPCAACGTCRAEHADQPEQSGFPELDIKDHAFVEPAERSEESATGWVMARAAESVARQPLGPGEEVILVAQFAVLAVGPTED